MPEQLVNQGTTTLNGSINNSATSITVTSGSVFPATGNFRIRIDDELLLCTARSSNTLTVTRGIEGTSAASHSDLAAVSQVLTKAGFDQYLTEYPELSKISRGAFGSRPSAVKAGNIYIASDSMILSEDTGSAFVHHGPVWPFGAMVSGDWTWNNQSTATVDFTKGYAYLFKASQGGTVFQRGLNRILPGNTSSTAAGNYTVTFCFIHNLPPNANTAHFGVMLRDNTASQGDTARIVTFSYDSQGTFSYDRHWEAGNLNNNVGTVSTGLGYFGELLWIRIRDDNTNRYFDYSRDGVNFRNAFSASRTDWMTPNEVGFYIGATSADAGVTVLSYVP